MGDTTQLVGLDVRCFVAHRQAVPRTLRGTEGGSSKERRATEVHDGNTVVTAMRATETQVYKIYKIFRIYKICKI